MAAVTLKNDIFRVVVDPQQGVSVLAFFAHNGKSWLPLMPDTCRENAVLDVASFLMVPYSNRIENGLFLFEGVEYQLANGETHAMHGDVHSRAWFMQEASQEHICCQFESASHRDLNWPWPFEARVKYSLDRNEFSSELVLRNCGSTAMPAGLGWHPYFNRELTTKGEAVHLHMKVLGSYPDANDNRIPSGPPQPLTPEQDFSVEKPLPDDRFLDTCFHGYDGNGYIVWPDSKVKLTFECSAHCSHLVIYHSVGLPYFAVEPVTNANNGVNLYAGSEPISGVVSLLSGETLAARFVLRGDML